MTISPKTNIVLVIVYVRTANEPSPCREGAQYLWILFAYH